MLKITFLLATSLSIYAASQAQNYGYDFSTLASTYKSVCIERRHLDTMSIKKESYWENGAEFNRYEIEAAKDVVNPDSNALILLWYQLGYDFAIQVLKLDTARYKDSIYVHVNVGGLRFYAGSSLRDFIEHAERWKPSEEQKNIQRMLSCIFPSSAAIQSIGCNAWKDDATGTVHFNGCFGFPDLVSNRAKLRACQQFIRGIDAGRNRRIKWRWETQDIRITWISNTHVGFSGSIIML
ncbi:MAG TPA: hypothetical protein VEA58_06585 [Anaerovoracaceae bacterium]|nr:hypothetical protein [Anaerovoracaceae bacterium]